MANRVRLWYNKPGQTAVFCLFGGQSGIMARCLFIFDHIYSHYHPNEGKGITDIEMIVKEVR